VLPRKIGVVTSLDGAAVRDIIRVLRRRYANAHIVIRPARVQGEGAALEIARALTAICKVKGVDVVIVGPRRRLDRDLRGRSREVRARAIAVMRGAPTIPRSGQRTDVTDRRLRGRPARANAVAAAEHAWRARRGCRRASTGLSQRLDSSHSQRLHGWRRGLQPRSRGPATVASHGPACSMRSRRATMNLTTDLRHTRSWPASTRAPAGTGPLPCRPSIPRPAHRLAAAAPACRRPPPPSTGGVAPPSCGSRAAWAAPRRGSTA
jgi:exonuclease VII large subunit